MRLLHRSSHGNLTFTDNLHDSIPAYAILSHTWGNDEDEVTFRDMEDGSGLGKKGYEKIKFCGEQAARDGLQYFWVDTCAIDKRDNVELTEAINSMFRWYQNAAKCYVYLADVQAKGADQIAWETAFRRSRWFSRGWTLQELIAPSSIEFFSDDYQRLGDKHTLQRQICEITGLPRRALHRGVVSEFTVEERMLWAKNRTTKRGEDMAYCLMGILDISMPANYGEGEARAIARLKRELAIQSNVEAALPQHEQYRTPFSLQGVPKVNKFIDRPSEMDDLEQALLPHSSSERQRIFVLCGLGGIGKTQLAIEFARKHHRRFTSVFWLDGRTEETLKQSIASCASRIPEGQIGGKSRMHTADNDDINAIVSDVLTWLQRPDNTDWLLVFDNVDRDYRERDADPQAYDVSNYFSGADHGSVLITTRLSSLEELGSSRRLGKLSEDQADAMFRNRYGRRYDTTEAKELFNSLDGLPLAITQAASYIRQSGISIVRYIRLYEQQWKQLMESQERSGMPLHDYPGRSILTTWAISFDAIQSRNTGAANLLLLWACLDNKDMWYDLLAGAAADSTAVAASLSGTLERIASDEVSFLEAMQLLRAYSLVEDMQNMESFATHPVVHRWALTMQTEEQRKTFTELAITVVGRTTPHSSTKDYWLKQRRLLPHAYRCWGWVMSGYGGSAAVLGAIYGLGMLYADQGKLKEAENMYVRALEGYEKAWGADHTSTLSMVNNLGNLYANQGKLAKAEKMYERALEGYEKAWGADHTLTLDTVNNLGALYKDQGKLTEAEKMYVRALEGKEKEGVPDHALLHELNNLGILYADQVKLVEAEKMYVRALEGKEKALGPQHTSTLDTVNNLGALYFIQGKLVEAEEMYVRALDGYEKALGPDSVKTYIPALNSMYGLGVLLASEGRVEEARATYLAALDGREKVFGRDNTKCKDVLQQLRQLDTSQESQDLHHQATVPQLNTSRSPLSFEQTGDKSHSRRKRLLRKLGLR